MKLSVLESWNELKEPCFSIFKNGQEILQTVRQSEDEPPASKIALANANFICERVNEFESFEIERAKYNITIAKLRNDNNELLKTLKFIKTWCEESKIDFNNVDKRQSAIFHSFFLAKEVIEMYENKTINP